MSDQNYIQQLVSSDFKYCMEPNHCDNSIQSCYPTFLVQLRDTSQQTQFLSVRVWWIQRGQCLCWGCCGMLHLCQPMSSTPSTDQRTVTCFSYAKFATWMMPFILPNPWSTETLGREQEVLACWSAELCVLHSNHISHQRSSQGSPNISY